MTTMDYLGSLLAPYSYALPGASASEILSSPMGGTSSSDALEQIAKLLGDKAKGKGSPTKTESHSKNGNNGSSRRLQSMPDSVHNSVNENRRLAKAVIERRYPKWDRADFKDLVSLWNRESGWQADAENSTSTASGIPQMMLSVHDVPKGYQHSPLTQIITGLKYIRGRYGDPENAWQHSQQTGWY